MNQTATTTNSRSLVLVDTSVLFIDPDVLVRVVGNNGIPFITKTVLDEIDFNKKNQDQSVSHNARYILRELSELPSSEMSALPGGKPICTGDTVRQFTFLGKSIFVLARDQFRERGNDAKIIEVAKDYGMIVITRDAGFKVRAETEGLESHLWSEKNRSQATHQQTVQQPSPSGQVIPPFGLPGTPVSVRDVQLPVSMIPVSGQAVITRDHGTVGVRQSGKVSHSTPLLPLFFLRLLSRDDISPVISVTELLVSRSEMRLEFCRHQKMVNTQIRLTSLQTKMLGLTYDCIQGLQEKATERFL